MPVVVAGAGISGLAAALHLAEAGVEVLVVEPRTDVGGLIRTSPFAGRAVDEGPDAFLIRTSAALDLARHVGLGGELVHPARRDARVWIDGALRPLPRQVLGVPTDPDQVAALDLLSPAGLARLRDDLGAPATTLPDDDVALGPAVRARLGDEAYERLVAPLVGGISAGDPDRLSLRAVAPQVEAALRDPTHPSLVAACRAQVDRARGAAGDGPVFAAPAQGMARLPRAVAEAAVATGRVEVRLGVGVAAIGPAATVVLDDGEATAADGVIVATPGPAAAQLLGDVSPEAARLLAGVEHVSVAFVRLAVRLDDLAAPLEGSGLLVPRGAGRVVTACSWASEKWAHLRPERGDGTTVVRAAVGRDGDQAALALDDEALIARVVDDLDALVGLRAAPTEASVHRHPGAFPQYRPGHLERTGAMEEALAEDAPHVAIAGMHLRGVGIPAAVGTARAAADRILARLR